jgi:hypothetical protein
MGPARLLVAVLGGGVAWALHLAGSYFIIALGCPRQWPEIGLLLGLITVAAVGSTAASGLVAWSGWRLAPTPADGTGFAAESSRLLCLVGLLLSGLFTTLVLLGGISPLVLPPCTAT